MSAKRALVRLVFLVIFIIPVGWYLFLQLFGTNTFTLPDYGTSACQTSGITIVQFDSVSSRQERNQSGRLVMRLERKKFKNLSQQDCGPDSADFLLVDSQRQIRGIYTYERSDIDRLLIELDILMRIENYGDVVRR